MPITRIAGAIDHAVKGTEGDMLSPEDANAKYGIKGVLNFDKPVSSTLASTLNEEKQNDLLRDNTIRNGAGGVIGHAVNAFAGAVPSFLDPINYAATMVPGLGEARISAGLGRLAAGLEDVGLTGTAEGALGAEAANRAAGRVIESNPFAQAANAAVLSGEMAITLLTSAVPLLIPDNTTARSAATALIPSAVALLGKKTGKDNQSPT